MMVVTKGRELHDRDREVALPTVSLHRKYRALLSLPHERTLSLVLKFQLSEPTTRSDA